MTSIKSSIVNILCVFLQKTWVCDGVADCKRGEEEMDCDVKCEVGQFSCPSKNSSPRQRYLF